MFPFSDSLATRRKPPLANSGIGATGSNPESSALMPNNSSPLSKQYTVYGTAVDQDAHDRDELMKGFKDFGARIAARGSMGGGKYTPGSYTPTPYKPPTAFKPETLKDPEQYNPKDYEYKRSAELDESLRKLKEFADTGGYSEEDKYNLRERGISPIRSIYSNAGREIDRSRALQGGGTSASQNALRSRMARELSDRVGSITTDVNANIAENVARNKGTGAAKYADVSGSESELANRYGKANVDERNKADIFNKGNINDTRKYNTDIINKANEFNLTRGDRARDLNTDEVNKANLFNIQNANEAFKFNRNSQSEDDNNIFRSLEGMRSLFGTTPALSQLFGNQALSFSGQQSGINQQNQGRGLDIISQLLKGFRG